MNPILKQLVVLFAVITISIASVPAASVAQTSGMGSDGNTRLLWRSSNLAITLWDVNSSLNIFASAPYGPYPGWSPIAMTAGINNYSYVLWTYATGLVGVWLVDPNLNFVGMATYGPYPGWTAESLSTGTGSTNMRLLWKRTDGALAIYSLDQNLNYLGGSIYGPYPGWNAAPVGQALIRQTTQLKNNIEAGQKMPEMAAKYKNATSRASRAMQQRVATAKKTMALPKI